MSDSRDPRFDPGDPIAAMLSGQPEAQAFPPESRYHGVALAIHPADDGTPGALPRAAASSPSRSASPPSGSTR